MNPSSTWTIPIRELNDVPRARAPGDVVQKHSKCGALTRHRGARCRRRRSRPTRLIGSLIAPRALPDKRGALRSEAKHTVGCYHITIGWHLEIGCKKESQSPATRTRNHPHIVRWGRSVKRQEVKGCPGTKTTRNAPLNVAPGISRASESIGNRNLWASQLGYMRHRIVTRRYHHLDIGPIIIGKVLI
jgi:hypothetical protein